MPPKTSPELSFDLWSPATATSIAGLSAKVSAFKTLDTGAGLEAEEWLKERCHTQYPGVSTMVAHDAKVVHGFFSYRLGEIELTTKQRKQLGKEHPRQGVLLLVWIARHRDCLDAIAVLLEQALATAAFIGGNIGLALDPQDEFLDNYWRSQPYVFRSRTKLPGTSLRRLWIPSGRISV